MGLHPSKASSRLGVRKMISCTTINILKENGFDPGPKRGKGRGMILSASTQRRSGLATFLEESVDDEGAGRVLRPFLHPGRLAARALAGMMPNLNARWFEQQARNVAVYFAELPDKPTYIARDYDAKFGNEFDAVFKTEDITVKKVGPAGAQAEAAIADAAAGVAAQALLSKICMGGCRGLRHVRGLSCQAS